MNQSNKGNVPQGHTFQGWYDEYMATDGNSLTEDSSLILAVKHDSFDSRVFDNAVAEFAAGVQDGFCLQCQLLFNGWPDLKNRPASDLGSSESAMARQGGWEHYLSTKSFHIYELEAATRQGCRFCALIRQMLVDRQTLEIYQKVEQRLAPFAKDLRITLSIQNWGQFAHTQRQLLWPNLPGKVCTSCNSGIALTNQLQTSAITSQILGT